MEYLLMPQINYNYRAIIKIFIPNNPLPKTPNNSPKFSKLGKGIFDDWRFLIYLCEHGQT